MTRDDIDAAGTWWTIVDIIDVNGTMTRSAFAWEISDAAAIQQSRAPDTIHVVTLLVIASLLVALVRRRMRRLLVAMNLSPVSVLLAVSVVVITLGILYAGAEMIAERQREYEATLNPPPAAINTVLPDAESLRRGEALYGEHCIVWQRAISRLPRPPQSARYGP